MHGEILEIGDMATRLLDQGFTVVISQDVDGESEEYSGSAGNGTDQRIASAGSLADLLRKLLEREERAKRCQGPCRKEKPLSAFAADANRADRKGTVCKDCMRGVSASKYKEKKAHKIGGGPFVV